MKKVYIKVDENCCGMVVAEDIVRSNGAVILTTGTTLDSHYIEKLERMDIESIRVYEKEPEVEAVSHVKFGRKEELKNNEPEVQTGSVDNFLKRDSVPTVEENTKKTNSVLDNQVSKLDNQVSKNEEIADNAYEETYEEDTRKYKDIMSDIEGGKGLDIEKVADIVASIADANIQNSDIVSCITQMREADEYTYNHCIDVSLLAMMFGKWLKLSENEIKDLVKSALLHDIGKLHVPSDIIKKPGKLTDDEFHEVKKHPLYGYQILKDISELNSAILSGVLSHHEKMDGTGYPQKLSGEKIHLFAKIIAIVDIYNAMTSNRPYKAGINPFKVFDMFDQKVFGALDTSLVKVFLKSISMYYIGYKVKLNNAEIGEIIYVNPLKVSKPLIKVGEEFIDLAKCPDIEIEEMLIKQKAVQ